jgi:hypothetical protein
MKNVEKPFVKYLLLFHVPFWIVISTLYFQPYHREMMLYMGLIVLLGTVESLGSYKRKWERREYEAVWLSALALFYSAINLYRKEVAISISAVYVVASIVFAWGFLSRMYNSQPPRTKRILKKLGF